MDPMNMAERKKERKKKETATSAVDINIYDMLSAHIQINVKHIHCSSSLVNFFLCQFVANAHGVRRTTEDPDQYESYA